MEAWKVRLTQTSGNTIGTVGQTLQTPMVVFDASPDLSENGSVSYKTIEPVHSPGGILVYANSSARTFQLSNIKLFSRTQEEATKNYHRLQTLKAWRYPSFGVQTQDDMYGTVALGAPPAVLLLSAYARPSAKTDSVTSNGLLYKIPVVIAQLGIDYPSDVDYIPTAQLDDIKYAHIPAGIPMPTILPISIQLMEAQAPSQYAKFSLNDFRYGRLEGF